MGSDMQTHAAPRALSELDLLNPRMSDYMREYRLILTFHLSLLTGVLATGRLFHEDTPQIKPQIVKSSDDF